ncbi:MAG TPA: carboxypeptidase-like regulatory domain-containing protein, partial [Gemmatimonadales bacterium]|nr:carboxypeptidase-like regulatory domain-containing protein [Gemmatimonadales bacterium]
MRQALLLAIFTLAACDGLRGTVLTEPDTDPVGRMFTVSGVVVDSMSGGAIPGVRVASGPYVTDADAAGQWRLTLPAGPVSITTSPTGYERVTTAFTLVANTSVALEARRLAPIVQQCTRDGESVHALVSDLQGRKTIERWQRSEAYVLDPAGTYRLGAPDWTYRALDYITWEIT